MPQLRYLKDARFALARHVLVVLHQLSKRNDGGNTGGGRVGRCVCSCFAAEGMDGEAPNNRMKPYFDPAGVVLSFSIMQGFEALSTKRGIMKSGFKKLIRCVMFIARANY